MKQSITFSIIVLFSFLIINSCRNATSPKNIEFFADPNFESLIREILDKKNGTITEFDLLNITNIQGQYRDIESIEGIEYCEFSSSDDALKGTAYAATKSNAMPFTGGSSNGSIIAEGSWISLDSSATYFVRGNIGIKIVKPFNFIPDDVILLDLITTKLVTKIESNLAQ